jgi:hypothetical protein
MSEGVVPAGPGDETAIAKVLASAFMDDPVWSWLIPRSHRMRRLESSNHRNLPFYRRSGFRVAEVLEFRRGPRQWTLWGGPERKDLADLR